MPSNEYTPHKSGMRMRAQRLVRLRRGGENAARLSLGIGQTEAARAQASASMPQNSKSPREVQASGVMSGIEREANPMRESSVLSTMLPFSIYGSADELAKRAVLCVFSVLPEAVRREIEGALRALGRGMDALEEIRLSLYSRSSIVLFGEERVLALSLTKEDFSLAVRGICHGTPFSYRAELAEGYLPFADGVRVGAVGEAHYDEKQRMVGVSDIHTLTFRIPHALPRGGAIESLCAYLSQNMHRGCLLLGTPRAGKTTLLRAIAHTLAEDEVARRVAVVDSRREFLPEDGASGILDILTGYRRGEGTAIALRTLSPSYIVMDEVGTEEDVNAIRGVVASGVPVLASAHASSLRDARARRYLRVLLEDGAFDLVLVMRREREGVRLALYRV